MKRLTFVYSEMVMGGAELFFLRLISIINRKQYKVNAVLLKQGGELDDSFPEDVKVDFLKPRPLSFGLKGFRALYYRVRIRLAKSSEIEGYYTWKSKICPEELFGDCAFCLNHFNVACISTVAFSRSKTKVLFVQSSFRNSINKKVYTKLLSKFDKVFCVSKTIKDEFQRFFPMYADKAEVFYPLIFPEEIRKKAEEPIPENLEHISLLTLARLSEEKGVLMIPGITRLLLQYGYNVNWYLIGEGNIKDEIYKEIEDNAVQDHVFLLGEKNNPYPYLKILIFLFFRLRWKDIVRLQMKQEFYVNRLSQQIFLKCESSLLTVITVFW